MTKVLFVEERQGLRAVITDALSDVGYDVQTVAAQDDDLAAYRSVRPDLVIYDRDSLTGKTVSALDRIIGRMTQDGKHPVIVLNDSGDVELEDGRCALCLPGPLDVDALIVAAAGLLSGELAGAPAPVG